MRIEVKEKASKEFYEEVVNAMTQYRKLLKNPAAKLTNNFKTYRTSLLVLGVLFVLDLVMGFMWTFDTLTTVSLVVVALAALLCFVYLNNMNKLVNNYLSDTRTSVVTLDENGVELNKTGSQVVRLGWDNVAFVRAFKESTCFVAKDLAGLVIAVNNLHKDELLGYIRDNNIDVRVVE